MAVNEFLTFATDVGANIEGQPDYLADAIRKAGNQRGIASSSLNNKAIRQGTWGTAGISSFILNMLAEDVLDNADLVAWENQFERALRAYVLQFTRGTLPSDLQLYVNAATGLDTNPGTIALPFKSIQQAWNYSQEQIDVKGHQVNVYVADGNYGGTSGVEGLRCAGAIVGANAAYNTVNFIGNAGTPANCVINGVNAYAVSALNSAQFSLNGFRLTSSGTGVNQGIDLFMASAALVGLQNVEFGVAGRSHMLSQTGAQLELLGNYRINGAAPIHAWSNANGFIRLNTFTCTIIGNPNFSTAFALANTVGSIESVGVAWSGTATGVRAMANAGGQFNVGGAGAGYFPGSLPNVVDRVDQYE